MLKERHQDNAKMQKRSNRAATRVLLWELRRAFCERRTPDLELAAHLLDSGAKTRPREEDSSDDEEDHGSRLGGPRYTTDFDDSPRNSLDFLAMNRFADPQKLEIAIKKAVEYNADPTQYCSYERPLAVAVRSRNVAAVKALMALGAPVDRQALNALQLISDKECRQEIEDRFLAAVNSGDTNLCVNLCIKDMALWVLVQSGYVKATRRRIQLDHAEVNVDASTLVGLRRCRSKPCRQELRSLLVSHLGELSIKSYEQQAATAELVLELREAMVDQRDPDEETVSELVALGANVQARGVDLDTYMEDEDPEDDAEDSDDTDSEGEMENAF